MDRFVSCRMSTVEAERERDTTQSSNTDIDDDGTELAKRDVVDDDNSDASRRVWLSHRSALVVVVSVTLLGVCF